MDIAKASCPGCGHPMTLTRVHCADCDLTLDGEFEVSDLARLPLEDQVFLVAFLRHHGSIKRMEALFGISYPTVKNRLNALAAKLDRQYRVSRPQLETLALLERGEITVDEALARLAGEEDD